MVLITGTQRNLAAVCTTSDIQCMAGSDSILVADGFYPIGTRICTALISCKQICIEVIAPVPKRSTGVELHYVLNFHVLLSSQHLWKSVYIRNTDVSIVADLELTFLTLLGGNEDNTISSGRTIDGTRSGILQNVDTFDVGRVQVVDVTCYTVNNIKRSGVAVSTGTTDRNLETITWLTRVGLDVNTRSLALESTQCLSGVQFSDIFTLYFYSSTCNEFLLLDTVTYYYHFVQTFGIFLQCNLIILSTTYSDFFYFITNVRDVQSSTRLHVQCELTVQISDSTIACTLF